MRDWRGTADRERTAVWRVTSTCFGLSVLVGLVGCATTLKATIELEAMTIEAVDVDGKRRVEILDPEVLFNEANAAYDKRDFKLTIEKYELLIERFPETSWSRVATYNLGLALERSGQFERAIPQFVATYKWRRRTKDAQDALFRIAACQEALERWVQLRKSTDKLLRPEYPAISPVERLEAETLNGLAHQHIGELAVAERRYKSALKLFKRHIANRALAQSRYVSMAQYQVGEIYRELFEGIRFKLPVERMERDLEEKSNLFLKAQNAYLKTVRFQHREYAVNAGFRLGNIYEVMYEHLLSAEVPPNLTEEDIEVYYEELNRQLKPLISKAINIFERNLKLAERMGKQGEWMRRTDDSLRRLKAILEELSVKDAMSKLKEQTAGDKPSEDAP